MAKLAIKGHSTRSKEIIELLEMMGGENKFEDISFIKPYHFLYVDDDYYTEIGWEFIGDDNNYEEFVIYTLEEFLEKYPYKVGDKVILDEIPCTITWMCWECNNIYYQVQGVNDIFTKKVTAEKLKPYKGETMEDKDIIEPTTEINLNHPCFDGHNKIELIIPENWKFEQIDNKMFGIRKYPQYPKTYEECCNILGIEDRENGYCGYEYELLGKFQKLYICRNAYWKIAGEQMGLGKPWEPDFTNNDEERYGIYTLANKVERDFCGVGDVNMVLSFPTEEMRDIFYKNFMDLIEGCKKLL